MKTAEFNEFKVGDRVRLKDGLVAGKVYCGLTLLKDMMFNGFLVIERISNYGSLIITGYFYSPEMLTL